MSRITIGVDARLRAQAAKILGTTTKTATATAALQAAVDREKRREFPDWLTSGGLPELTGPTDPARPDTA
ncbi:type II toxin-antitoxin system VapB family antitoxin [Micromonospora zamorensis]|uniref:type II toxin-antitoxin system VapB family antitoxin n=1 Tax=Micromonospora zamorensis TaxID=709883 RepID=UPI0034106B6C